MKSKYKAVMFDGQYFNEVKSFKHEKEAVSFVESHSELTLKRVDSDGRTFTWNEQKGTWED